MPVSNLPVNPYDGGSAHTPLRDPVTGAFKSEYARHVYIEEMESLIEDCKGILTDFDLLLHQRLGIAAISHVSTREACRLILESAIPLVSAVRDLIQIEAQG